jgi:hypothetical protein
MDLSGCPCSKAKLKEDLLILFQPEKIVQENARFGSIEFPPKQPGK